MNELKMSSDEVPGKFTEWLLGMGCPAEKIPTKEKIAEMCRGQYYMVWRSLMEQVHAQDVVRNRRLQVFCDDMRKCQSKKFCEKSSSAIVPEQLTLWKEQNEVQQNVEEAQKHISLLRHDLDQIMDKVTSKMAQRELAQKKAEDLSRRVWLLQQVARDLQVKKTNLNETKTIADSLCSIDDDTDIQMKLEKCLAAFRSQNCQQDCNSTANSVTSNNGESDFETLVWAVTKCRGDIVSQQLLQRRAALVKALGVVGEDNKGNKDKVTPQCILAHTAALHCTLALEATKNRILLKETRKKLLNMVNELNIYLSGEACELLVLRCEKAHLEARVTSRKLLLDELNTRTGPFYVGEGEDRGAGGKSIATLDKAIECKKEELKRVITTLAMTERKISNARECLCAVFAAFKKDALPPPTQYRGVQLDLPRECIASLREYYSARRERARREVDLSLELELSAGSIADTIDHKNPRFMDELRIYLKNFNLDNNRQLVLENGEKIWIFETVQSSKHRLLSSWVTADVSCSLLDPVVGFTHLIRGLGDLVERKAELQARLKILQDQIVVKEIGNGEKIWIFETVQSSKHRLLSSWVTADVSCSLLDPVVGFTHLIRGLGDLVERKAELQARLKILQDQIVVKEIDLSSEKRQEEQIRDHTKKRLQESLSEIQKVDKSLSVVGDNLTIWASNNVRKYISTRRKVDGMTYSQYENAYLENCISV